jgi:predicted nuclease of predicted toxin-antitoxin system
VTFWLDKQISPLLAPWIEEQFGVQCVSVVNLPVDRASDEEIFFSARESKAIIVGLSMIDMDNKPPCWSE